MQHACRTGNQLRSGQIHMPHRHGDLPQHVFQCGTDALLTFRRHAQCGSDAIRREKADALEILTQPVGIGADNLRRALAVQLVVFVVKRILIRQAVSPNILLNLIPTRRFFFGFFFSSSASRRSIFSQFVNSRLLFEVIVLVLMFLLIGNYPPLVPLMTCCKQEG